MRQADGPSGRRSGPAAGTAPIRDTLCPCCRRAVGPGGLVRRRVLAGPLGLRGTYRAAMCLACSERLNESYETKAMILVVALILAATIYLGLGYPLP